MQTSRTNPRTSDIYPTIDVSLCTVYGIDDATKKILRSYSGGKLKSQKINGEEFPPYVKDLPGIMEMAQYKSEMVRPGTNAALHSSGRGGNPDPGGLLAFGHLHVNMTPGTIAWGVLFLREHNRICDLLHSEYPQWDDERLFQTARNITTCIFIKIAINDYVGKHNAKHVTFPIVFEPDALAGIKEWPFGAIRGVPIEWNHLYRFHTFAPDEILFKGKKIPFTALFMRPDFSIQHGLNAIVDQLCRYPCPPFGPQNTPDFLLHLDRMTIEAGRTVNLASYNEYRDRMDLPRILRFEEMSSKQSVVDALKKHYKTVDEIEFYVGLVAEEVQENRLFPMLLQKILTPIAIKSILAQPWFAPHIWSQRKEMLSPFGAKYLEETTMETLFRRHVSKETYVSFFLPEN